MTRTLASDGGMKMIIAGLNLLVWAGYLAFFLMISAIEGQIPLDIPQRSLVYGLSAVLGFIATYSAFTLLKDRVPFRWSLTALIAVAFILVHSLLGAAVWKLWPPYDYVAEVPFKNFVLATMLYDTPIVIGSFLGIFAIHFGREISAKEKLLLETDIAARHAQLETLRHQLNPHFLFNTLNTVSSLVLADERQKAEEAILLLSKFLRRSIDADPLSLVPLKDEFENVTDYLAVESTRFGDRLHVEWSRDPHAEEIEVPPFLLQPVVENVIKHAVAKVARPITIHVRSELDRTGLHLTVEDDGPGLGEELRTAAAPGIGLEATRTRLALLYGDDASLALANRSPSGVKVDIIIPGEGG